MLQVVGRLETATSADGVHGAARRRCREDVEAADWRRMFEQVERMVRLGSFEMAFGTEAVVWSEGTYAIFGVPPHTPITLALALSFYDEPVRELIGWHLDAARRTGQPYDVTVPFRTGGGEPRWARIIGQVEQRAGGDRLIGVVRDVTSERDMEDQLRRQANQDALTALPNRRAFETHLNRALAVGPADLAVCIVDVDWFKGVNDAHGHGVGDKLLQAIGLRLLEAVRAGDVVARLGGDEFAVVLHDMGDEAGLRRRLAAIVGAAREPLALGEVSLEPSVSVGSSPARRATTVDLLLKQADVALYKAKVDGRDQFCVYRPSLHQDAQGHGRLLHEVRAGLVRGQFEVHYQPIVDLRTRVVRGWEALVRWRHPNRGLLVPGCFAAALTDPRTSIEIDDFVLEASLRQMRLWLDAGVPVTCAGVNVSDAQLKRPDLVDRIMSLLAEYRLTPDRLKIEVLETTLVGVSTRGVAATIGRLAELGVVSALDDFGTGYASLSHLKHFRIGRLKIDRSFVANVGADGYDQAIVRCMVALGRDLGIRITVEGVETVEQLRMVRRLGCDVGQGYLFGRPMPPDEVPEFLNLWRRERANRLFDESDHVKAPLRIAG